jgi:ribosomal protein S18 acetylase RimI-like enzyme
MNGIVFQRATKEDAQTLIEVQNESFREDYETYGECPAYEESLEKMTEMIENALVYKTECQGRIISDAIVRKRDDGGYYLRVLAVIPEFQGKGIGKAMVQFLEEELDDGKYWCLITPKQSDRNRHFYESLGYRNVGEEKHSELLTLIDYRKDIL